VADLAAGSVTIFTDPYRAWSWAIEPRVRLGVEFGPGPLRPARIATD
jgi:hypothetical protein